MHAAVSGDPRPGDAEERAIFIVGNSRSGTTLMSRIVGRHPRVFRFRELHFFDRFWSTGERGRVREPADAERVARALCARQRDGRSACTDQARALVAALPVGALTRMGVFEAFLRSGAAGRGRTIPCEQTGRNVFYIGEILEHFPGARIVDIVRDPRDVLLSQKRKWRSHAWRDKSVDLMFREITNYHPLTVSRLWAAAVRAGDRYAGHPQVHIVRFEELLRDPEGAVRAVFAFCDLDFAAHVLDVPQVGSSTVPNARDTRGIDPARAGNWRRGGLNPTEVWLCQVAAGGTMEAHGYERASVRPNAILLAYYLASMPIKAGIALMNNARTMASAGQAVGRRLSA